MSEHYEPEGTPGQPGDAASSGIPTVSIVVPVYNAQRTLDRCVSSILGQEYTDFEVILVDDGSTDASPQMCDDFAEKDPRVRVIHQDNRGVSEARNAAFDIARGTYLQFVDCDDWISPDATKLMVREMQGSDVDMVVSDFYRVVGQHVSHKGDIEVDSPITPQEYADWMLEDPADYYYGSLWNKLLKRQIVEERHLRMDPALNWCEDFIFAMEYILYTRRIAVLRVPVYYYVKTAGSLVDQNLTVGNAVHMKLTMIEYYRDFYRRLLAPKDYRERRADIYRFLLDLPDDDAVVPIMPSTKRLGSERAKVYVNPRMAKSAPAYVYYTSKLLDRCIAAVAARFKLDLLDVKIISFLQNAGGELELHELADYIEVMYVQALALVRRLSLKKLVAMDIVRGGEDSLAGSPTTSSESASRRTVRVKLLPEAAPIVTALAEALREFERQRCHGFSGSERTELQALEDWAYSNAVDALRH